MKPTLRELLEQLPPESDRFENWITVREWLELLPFMREGSKCVVCGKRFFPKRIGAETRYCPDHIWMWNEPPDRFCERCHKRIRPHKPNQKYCLRCRPEPRIEYIS